MHAEDIVIALKNLPSPFGSYILVGGAVLALRGIRDTHDIDIVVTPIQPLGHLITCKLDTGREKDL